MIKAQRPSTLKLYASYIKRWMEFSNANGYDFLEPTVPQGLAFLHFLFSEGNRKYTTLNTARSALSLLISIPEGKFGEHRDVIRFMKGINQIKPTLPRYIDTWDPDLVLNLFKTWSPAVNLSLELLTYKTVVLLLLVSGRRPQIIRNLNVERMKISGNSFTFIFQQTDLKEGRVNFKPEPLKVKKYPADKRLCIYKYLTEYLKKTLEIRGAEKSFFLTTQKPHTQPSADSVSRWIKTVLNHAGVDTSHFKPGSTRAASNSKALRQGTPINEIMRNAGWSRESTFTKYYKKPLTKPDEFSNNVLGEE